MCGIVGVVSVNLTANERKAFRNLLVMDVLRGKHSTGIIAVDDQGECNINKKAYLPEDFLELPRTKSLINSAHTVCLIGHNRYATAGNVNNNNAHPFEFDNVVGVHNGTLGKYKELDDNWAFEVDSECLYNHIDRNGLQSAIDAVGGYDKGVNAWALAMVDKKTNQLIITRNDSRPMFYTKTKDGALFFASEHWMLLGALHRNNIEHGEIWKLDDDKKLTLNLPTIGDKELAPYTLEGVKMPAKKQVRQKTGGSNQATTNGFKGATLDQYRRFKEMREALKGKEVYFNPDLCLREYVEGTLLHSDYDCDVRVHVSENAPRGSKAELLRTKLENSSNCFSGLVKSVTFNKGRMYITIKWQSTTELSEKKTTELVDKHFNEMFLPNKTVGSNCSCSFCDNSVDVQDIVLDDHGQALFCKDCVGNADILAQLNDMGYYFNE